MKQENIQLIRHSLVKKMEELWFNADSTIAKMKNAEGRYADPFDQAATEANKFVELACRDRERKLILDIKETIKRIDKGSFGLCDHCGQTIHEKRLHLEPMSRLCRECQEEKEISLQRRNRQWSMRGMSYNHV